MSNKTDIQALTEQMQVLTSSIQDLSKNVAEMKSTGAAANTTQVIRPSDFSAKVSLVPAAVLSFVFSFFAWSGILYAAGIRNLAGIQAGIAITCVTIIAVVTAFFATKLWFKHLAKKPMLNIGPAHI